jgi:hypothetical protein
MSRSWDSMRRAKENEYFLKKNNEALEKLVYKSKKNSESNGVANGSSKDLMYKEVNIERCPSTGQLKVPDNELAEAGNSEPKKIRGVDWRKLLNFH